MFCNHIFILLTKIHCGYVTINRTQQNADLSQILHKTGKLNDILCTLKATNMSGASETELLLLNKFVKKLIRCQICFLKKGKSNIYSLNSGDQYIFLHFLHEHLQQMQHIFGIINSCSELSNLFYLYDELTGNNINDLKAGLSANIIATIKRLNIFGTYYILNFKDLCPLTYVKVCEAIQQHNSIIVEIYNILNVLQKW